MFNPPTGSHHGGVWGRLIKSVRKILIASLWEQMLNDKSLHTLLREAEAILNSRHITKASSDRNDLKAFMSNYLLLLKKKSHLFPQIYLTNNSVHERD